MTLTEFQQALSERESAAQAMTDAAAALSSAYQRFKAASEAVLQFIPILSHSAGERARERHACQRTDNRWATVADLNHQRHEAAAAGHGAALHAERNLVEAFERGFHHAHASPSFGFELSPDLAAFLARSIETAKTLPPTFQPERKFGSTVSAQVARIRQLANQL